MKTKFLSLLTISALVLGLSTSTYAATNNNSGKNNNEVSTVLPNISKINNIEIHGNVELYVSDGSSDQVKVYNRYYAENALVQNQSGVLRISSYSDQKLVVWVTAKELRSITAYDDAQVKSFGKLSPIELNVNLHNNASANLNLEVYSASITLADHAKADLSGSANDLNLKHDIATSVNKYNFAAAHYTDNSKTKMSVSDMDLAVL